MCSKFYLFIFESLSLWWSCSFVFAFFNHWKGFLVTFVLLFHIRLHMRKWIRPISKFLYSGMARWIVCTTACAWFSSLLAVWASSPSFSSSSESTPSVSPETAPPVKWWRRSICKFNRYRCKWLHTLRSVYSLCSLASRLASPISVYSCVEQYCHMKRLWVKFSKMSGIGLVG